MAVIAHGLNRNTKDSDIWLDPSSTPEEWMAHCLAVLDAFPGAYAWSLAERRKLESPQEVLRDVVTYDVIRIGGLDLPLDIFRKPNELEMDEFDTVWNESGTMEDGTRLMNEIDLIRTKIDTGRDHDWKDQLFLETKVRSHFRERLPACDLAEASSLLDRFLDPQLLQHARLNPHPGVRGLALKHLREFAAEGDPYSRDILEEDWDGAE